MTQEIDLCPMEDIVKELQNYLIEDHKFEIYALSCMIKPPSYRQTE